MALTHKQRIGLFNSQKRRRSFVDPTYGLNRTSVITDAASFDPDALGFNTLLPITLALDLIRTDTASDGVLFEYGSSTRGVAAAIDNDKLHFCAGTADATNTGVDTTTTGAFLSEDVKYSCVFTIVPNLGSVNVWINGQLAAAGQSVDGDFDGNAADTGLGILTDVEGTINPRIPSGLRITLVNTTLVSSLSVYLNQRPKQYGNLTLGTDGGSGAWANTYDSQVSS